MRKTGAIILSLFYVMLTIGITVNHHYCMGELESVTVYELDKDCCCDMSMMAHCCDDELAFFQMDDDQTAVAETVLTPKSWVQIISQNRLEIIQPIQIEEPVNLEFQDLPPPDKQPLWLLFNNFTYYG